MIPVTVRMTRAGEWRERRDLRLEMLADTPIAFGDTLAAASAFPDSEWMSRAERAKSPGNCCAVAITEEGRWVGTMSAFLTSPTRALLVTVYVSPGFRGADAGIADRLLDEVERWVGHETSATEFALDVHEENHRAIAFYLRRGFEPTGNTHPYPLDPSALEREFVKPMGSAPAVD